MEKVSKRKSMRREGSGRQRALYVGRVIWGLHV